MGLEGQCHGKIHMAKNPWKGNTSADNLRKQRGNSLKTKSGQKGSVTGTDQEMCRRAALACGHRNQSHSITFDDVF